MSGPAEDRVEPLGPRMNDPRPAEAARRPRRVRLLAGLLGLLALSGCNTPLARGTWLEPSSEADDPGVRRDWISLGVLGSLIDEDEDVEVEDGFGVFLEGGRDLTRGSSLPIAIEGGLGWAQHDTDLLVGSGDVTIWRFYTGARLWFAEGADQRWAPYVRGGVLYALFEEEGQTGLEEGFGWYAGGGLDYQYSGGAYIGPFVTFAQGGDEDLRQVVIGLGATWRF